MNIRPATFDDADWLLMELRDFSRFFGTRRSLFPDDERTALLGLSHLIRKEPIFVAEASDGERVGFVAGTLAPHPFNPEIMVLTELFWWVTTEHRGSSAGARLLEKFINYGREHADWINLTLEANSPINPATLERRGFRLRERSYLLEVT